MENLLGCSLFHQPSARSLSRCLSLNFPFHVCLFTFQTFLLTVIYRIKKCSSDLLKRTQQIMFLAQFPMFLKNQSGKIQELCKEFFAAGGWKNPQVAAFREDSRSWEKIFYISKRPEISREITNIHWQNWQLKRIFVKFLWLRLLKTWNSESFKFNVAASIFGFRRKIVEEASNSLVFPIYIF